MPQRRAATPTAPIASAPAIELRPAAGNAPRLIQSRYAATTGIRGMCECRSWPLACTNSRESGCTNARVTQTIHMAQPVIRSRSGRGSERHAAHAPALTRLTVSVTVLLDPTRCVVRAAVASVLVHARTTRYPGLETSRCLPSLVAPNDVAISSGTCDADRCHRVADQRMVDGRAR